MKIKVVSKAEYWRQRRRDNALEYYRARARRLAEALSPGLVCQECGGDAEDLELLPRRKQTQLEDAAAAGNSDLCGLQLRLPPFLALEGVTRAELLEALAADAGAGAAGAGWWAEASARAQVLCGACYWKWKRDRVRGQQGPARWRGREKKRAGRAELRLLLAAELDAWMPAAGCGGRGLHGGALRVRGDCDNRWWLAGEWPAWRAAPRLTLGGELPREAYLTDLYRVRCESCLRLSGWPKQQPNWAALGAVLGDRQARTS